jgi:SOS response regulatory protein OraA/RecX
MSEEDIEKAKNTSDFQKNLEKVYRFAMVRQRAEKEFVDYFKRKKINPSFHLKLLKKLKHLNLLNDFEFARSWVNSRLKKKSLKVVKLELQQKGTPPQSNHTHNQMQASDQKNNTMTATQNQTRQ